MAGVVCAALLSLWGAGSFYAMEKGNRDQFGVGEQRARFQELLAAVPENAVLGYVTDVPEGNDVDTLLFDTASYVLAPRLLERGANRPWVLGDFSAPLDFQGFAVQHGLRLERDFGRGVVLFRSETR